MQAVFGTIVQLKTRGLYKCIPSTASWDAPVSLTAEGIKELEYWKQNVRVVNQKGQTISPNLDAEIYMFTDASSVGYGGYVSHKGVSGTKSLMSSGKAQVDSQKISQLGCVSSSGYSITTVSGDFLVDRFVSEIQSSEGDPELCTVLELDIIPEGKLALESGLLEHDLCLNCDLCRKVSFKSTYGLPEQNILGTRRYDC